MQTNAILLYYNELTFVCRIPLLVALIVFYRYTGVSYADVVSITNENLFRDDNGALWLKYRRKKNELRASVKLLPEALALLEKYRDENRETLFPIIYHPNMKRHMKALAALAGIKDNLCYHQARHCVFYFSLKFNILQNISA